MHSAGECPVGITSIIFPLHFVGLIPQESARDTTITGSARDRRPLVRLPGLSIFADSDCTPAYYAPGAFVG